VAVGNVFADGFYVFADGFKRSAKDLFPVVFVHQMTLTVQHHYLIVQCILARGRRNAARHSTKHVQPDEQHASS
jgi:hypothetical protein